jgi:hypothetical protein
LQVTPNLYGTLVANTAAGIAGGTGVMPGGIEGFFCPNSKLSSTERGLLEAWDDTLMLSRDFLWE